MTQPSKSIKGGAVLRANPTTKGGTTAPRGPPLGQRRKSCPPLAAAVRYALSVNDCWRPLPTEMGKRDYFALADAVSFWKRGSRAATIPTTAGHRFHSL